MKVKEGVMVKLIKRFYGISGVLDEYKQSQINQIGNHAFMALFCYMLCSNFLATLFATKFPENTLWALITCNLLFILFPISGYVLLATSRLKLTENEVEAEHFETEKKKVKLKGIGLGIYFAITMHFLTALTNMLADGGNFFSNLVAPQKISASLLGGLFFGGAMFLALKTRLKKIEEKEAFKKDQN